MDNNENIKINIDKTLKIQRPELQWESVERTEIEERILYLRNDQIGALAKIILGFNDKDIPSVVQDIQENGIRSGHLPIILEEAESKEKLKWWVDYFEGKNN